MDIFFKRLCEEAAPRGFIGKSDQETLWLRHILDSLLVFNIKINWGKQITDLGSGAGLPGVVLGIMLDKNQKVRLLDSSRKKIKFLLDIKETLKLTNIEPLAANADQDFSQKNDTVVFRAFQKPIVSLELSLNHLKLGGQIIYWRSKTFMFEKDSVLNNKLLERLEHLGLSIVEHAHFKSPIKLGDRGAYIFLRNSGASNHSPRSFQDILTDPSTKF